MRLTKMKPTYTRPIARLSGTLICLTWLCGRLLDLEHQYVDRLFGKRESLREMPRKLTHPQTVQNNPPEFPVFFLRLRRSRARSRCFFHTAS